MGDAAGAALAKAGRRTFELPAPNCKIEVRVVRAFESTLCLSWALEPKAAENSFSEFVVEMVIDHAGQSKKSGQEVLQPPKGAMVKRVEMGKDLRGNIQSMPSGRRFFIAVVAKTVGGQEKRSPWINAETLSPDTRENIVRSVDPMNIPRASCQICSCPGYVPMFSANSLTSQTDMLCRHCGCRCTDHVAVEVQEILRKREEKLRTRLGRKEIMSLPEDALEWDTRECALWVWTEGAFHPRLTVGLHRPALEEGMQLPLGGPEGLSGRRGRVSVVTPTTDTRHRFHKALWTCFEAQTWPDKELVVVETYSKEHSAFFAELAKKDSRVHYIKFHRPSGQDWSIGLKRNIGTHLATGEFIANFDDDDLYAPEYLSSMVNRLEDSGKQAIKLSSWFIYNEATSKWGFCDPIAWGLSNGKDEASQDVRNWAYGYGFSYVFRRKAGLDVWYEDINLGEDYNFLTQLQHRRGKGSVTLLHDDFGICLHVQHGGNTSNSIPLRDVDREEAHDLDVVELAPHFARADPGALASGVLGSGSPPSQRRRRVRARFAGAWLEAECAVSATALDVLKCLSEQAGRDCASLEVHRVPPRGELSEASRDRAAVDVLGLGFLVRMPGVEENIRPAGKCGKQWRQLLDSAFRPMRGDDRIGLRTRELWLQEPEAGAEQEVADDGEREDFVVVGVSCQKTTAKKFFSVSSNAVQVRLPVDAATVGSLRGLLGLQLPPTARILEERPGKGLITLQDSDPVPDFVTVTDFKGQLGFYTKFTPRETLVALQLIKVFFMQTENQQKLDEMEASSQGSSVRYSALVSNLLANEVYPPILRRFDLPEEKPLQLVMSAMATVLLSKDLTALWLETEILMRNPVKIKEAFEHCIRMEIAVAEVAYRIYNDHASLPKVQEKAAETLQAVMGNDAEQEATDEGRQATDAAQQTPGGGAEARGASIGRAEEAEAPAAGQEQPAAQQPEAVDWEAAVRRWAEETRVAEILKQAEELRNGGGLLGGEAEGGGENAGAAELAAAGSSPEGAPIVVAVDLTASTAPPRRPARGGRGAAGRGRAGRRAKDAEQPDEPEGPLYEVVHERVMLRRHPTTDAVVVGTMVRGNVLRGSPQEVNGSPWLLLDERSRGRYANSRMDAWALIHGGSVGLGDLLLPVSAERVEVTIRHANTVGEVRLLVATTCTILEVKQALAKALGREMPAAKLVTKNGSGSFFSNCKDAEPLGERRELLLLGEKFG